MSKIQIAAFNQLATRLMSMKQEPGGVVSELAAELSAVLVLENDRPEWCYLKGEKCCAGNCNIPAVAAHVGIARFRNPLNSGTLMMISSIQLSPGTAATATIGELLMGANAGGVDFGTGVGTKLARDTRLITDAPAAVLSWDNTGLATIGTLIELGSTNNGMYPFINVPLIVIPGMSVDVELGVVNVQAFVNFTWLEREWRPYEV